MKIKTIHVVHELASLIFDYYIAHTASKYHFYGLQNVFPSGIVEEVNDQGLFAGNEIDSTELCLAIYNHDPALVNNVIQLCIKKDNLGVEDHNQWIDSFYSDAHPFSFWLDGKDVSELADEEIRKARTIQCLFFYVTMLLDDAVIDQDFSFTDAFIKYGWVAKRTIDDEIDDYYCMQRMKLCTSEQVQVYMDKANAWMNKKYGSGRSMFSSVTSVARSAYAECLANTDGKTIFEFQALRLN
ncbi:hypothetical protein LMH73_022990 [Vibrio splendidus]|nr:hypothetical protein [Vibrio splendidus]MCC4883022.1 hypothetical protein [Vibrio splendidus]